MSGRCIASIKLVSALALLAFGASACGSGSEPESAASVQFSAADGTTTSAAAFRGTPLVINMWASNCLPCLKEMPAFDEVATAMDGEVAIIGVNVFDDAATATEFALERGVTYPQFQDEEGRLSTALAVTGLPATAFFAADGALIEVHEGALTADDLRGAIEQHFPAPTDEETT